MPGSCPSNLSGDRRHKIERLRIGGRIDDEIAHGQFVEHRSVPLPAKGYAPRGDLHAGANMLGIPTLAAGDVQAAVNEVDLLALCQARAGRRSARLRAASRNSGKPRTVLACTLGRVLISAQP